MKRPAGEAMCVPVRIKLRFEIGVATGPIAGDASARIKLHVSGQEWVVRRGEKVVCRWSGRLEFKPIKT